MSRRSTTSSSRTPPEINGQAFRSSGAWENGMLCGQSGLLWIFFCLGLRDSRDLPDIAPPIETPGLTAPAPATDPAGRRHGALARRPRLDRTLTSCAAQISPPD